MVGASAPSKGAMSGSDDLLGDLVAKAQRGVRGETGALELLERETEMRNLSKKAKTIIAGAAIAGLASAGGAYAYWTTTGAGSGEATTSAGAPNLKVTQLTSPSDLAPGVASEAVTGSVTNNAANNAYTSEIVVTVASVAPSACAVGNYGLVAGTVHGILNATGAQTITLPFAHDMTPGQTLVMPAFDLGFINKNIPQNECQSAVPTISYNVH